MIFSVNLAGNEKIVSDYAEEILNQYNVWYMC